MVKYKVIQSVSPRVAAAAAAAPPEQQGAPSDIPLPQWNDFASVTTYITSVIGIAVGLITAFQPGFHEPAAVQAVVPAVSFLVATGAQIFNAVSHRNAHTAAAVAAINQGGTIAT